MTNENLTRRSLLKTVALGLSSYSLLSSVSTASLANSKPNIVLIVADDLGWADVNYHNDNIETPNINRLKKQGAELDRFYVCPLCSPTRAGLMTGRYPLRYGLQKTVIPPWRDFGLSTDEETLPELLGKVGYKNRACIGKWHLGHSRKKFHPLNRGFTEFYGHYNGAIDYFTHIRNKERDWHRGFEPIVEEGYATSLIGRESVDFIKRQRAGEPFFLYTPFNAPHSPLQSSLGVKLKKDRSNSRQVFKAMVKEMDLAIGNILDAIKEKGMKENTLVVFISDNGGKPKLGGKNTPLRGEKATLWEGGVRVPAIMSWPGKIKPGSKVSDLMGYIDLFPTLLAATGVNISPKNELDGIDVLPILRKKREAPKRNFYLGPGTAVNQEWKLINEALYNLDEDPGETTDVAKKYPTIARALQDTVNFYEAIESKEEVLPYHVGRKGFIAPKNWEMKE